MAGKDAEWLARTLEKEGYQVADPQNYIHDGKTRFLLVDENGHARWCFKDMSLRETIQVGETAYECPDNYWEEYTYSDRKKK